MTFFSIIVPIYKVENYLVSCIDSVLKQNFDDFELILVNDGSPDYCGLICDEFARQDSRIKVIHKQNQGPSEARNTGLHIAEGRYIFFLDGDDYMATSALKNIYLFLEKEKNIDMLTCAHTNIYVDGKEETQLFPMLDSTNVFSKEEYLMKLAELNGAYWAPWKNIYRKEIITYNKITFRKELSCAEDCAFFMDFVRSSNKCSFLNKPTINYRSMREGSITEIMSYSSLMDQMYVFYENYKISKKNKEEYSKYLKPFFANKFANVLPYLCILENKLEINNIISFIRSHEGILRDTSGWKYSGAKIIWNIFGYYKGSILLTRINSKVTLVKNYIGK